MLRVRSQMKRAAKPKAPPPAGRKAILYKGGKPKTIELILPVATPAELRGMVKLSRASRRRVERAITEAGLRRKSSSTEQDPSRTRNMKKVKTTVREPDMRAEYDFRGGVRGKYAARYADGTNVVLLEPDVAELFPDSRTVNDALRALVAIVDRRKLRKVRPAPAMARKARRS